MEAAALTNQSNALTAAERYEEVVAVSRRAYALFEESGDGTLQGPPLYNLGNALLCSDGSRSPSRPPGGPPPSTARRAAAAARPTPCPTWVTPCTSLKRYEEAVTAYERAAVLLREIGSARREGQVLGRLGAALIHLRRYEEAVTVTQQSAVLLRGTGDHRGEALSLTNLGDAAAETGRFAEAATACGKAAALFREIGRPRPRSRRAGQPERGPGEGGAVRGGRHRL